MPFNSDTYYANKYRKSAETHLAEARDIKARVAAGTAYDWEAPRIASLAKLAILDMRLSRSFRDMAASDKAFKAARRSR